ncbi:alpha-amylase family glycosyl hydrolase [Cytobacillus firmus]|uniref:alpha-amylase n=1 Tax=Cytobacillus firmus DS1 TaxID=1307436 RepID=W7KYV9_CYTFI|nr:alpha-amylase family glycosyl hydrolase [Cytobacillus firmus]EWG08511.1 alpha-amylase [Cytobacillus firmus DS1]MBG9546172.1 alpha-amlyase [Cytobacillus firmus]MBG9600917.1 alpha-amlyase [Cytobacillus firmus]MED1942755.1 alpha-amylase family glycosyl hydrolase [Cytobacillus firmus]
MIKKFISLFLITFFMPHWISAEANEENERKWQDETIYYIMVDRFNNGDIKNDFNVNAKNPESYQGGDFQGIIDKLDYLKDMGYTTLMLTPIFNNEENGYHGYWINDFYNTEDHFGSLKTFKRLIKEAHNRDMKIILEFPSKNIGPNHPWLKDSKKRDWLRGSMEHKGIGENTKENEFSNLPEINKKNPEVQKYLIDVAKWWIAETDIDGFQLNLTQNEPEIFWGEFSKEVYKLKDDFYLIAGTVPSDLNADKYEKMGMKSLINDSFSNELRSAFSKPDQSFENLFVNQNQSELSEKSPYLMGKYMDNPHTPRFTSGAVKNNQHPGPRWKLALTYLYTTPGVPIVYYGSEIALNGEEEPDNRKIMDFRTDKELIDFITKIGELRQQLPSLSKGTMEVLYKDDSAAVYKRVYNDEVTVTVINNSSQSTAITLSAEELGGKDKELRGLLAGDLVQPKDNKYIFVPDREESEIYILKEKTGLNIPLILSLTAVYTAFIVFIIALRKRAKKKRS